MSNPGAKVICLEGIISLCRLEKSVNKSCRLTVNCITVCHQRHRGHQFVPFLFEEGAPTVHVRGDSSSFGESFRYDRLCACRLGMGSIVTLEPELQTLHQSPESGKALLKLLASAVTIDAGDDIFGKELAVGALENRCRFLELFFQSCG